MSEAATNAFAAVVTDAAGQEYLLGLDRDASIAFHCHHGIRIRKLLNSCFTKASSTSTTSKAALTQGRLTIDASVPRYRYTTEENNMSSHPTDFQGSVIDALRAVDSLKTRAP